MDLLDKARKTRKTREQKIELESLEQLLHQKTKEIMEQFNMVDLRQTELEKAKETIEKF